jgi:hypothetical protein
LSAVKDQAYRTLHAQTGICRRTIPERQSRWPFVTFASFCSNFFADFCPPSKTKPAERYTPKQAFVEGPSRNANPVGPLLPLLPSVQISLLTFVRRQKPKQN